MIGLGSDKKRRIDSREWQYVPKFKDKMIFWTLIFQPAAHCADKSDLARLILSIWNSDFFRHLFLKRLPPSESRTRRRFGCYVHVSSRFSSPRHSYCLKVSGQETIFLPPTQLKLETLRKWTLCRQRIQTLKNRTWHVSAFTKPQKVRSSANVKPRKVNLGPNWTFNTTWWHHLCWFVTIVQYSDITDMLWSLHHWSLRYISGLIRQPAMYKKNQIIHFNIKTEEKGRAKNAR